MGELRRDPVIGRWVIVASNDQSLAPQDYPREERRFKQKATCQFCAGKEKQTPPEVDAVRAFGSHPNEPGWSVRAVPNKFPALKIEGELNKRGTGIYDVSNGVGAHEVIIETADHERNIAELSVEEITNVLKVFQSRAVSLSRDRRFKYIMIFKNYGESAGASVEHPHSQLIALPMVPKAVLEELDGARQYFTQRGRCVFCDIIHQEYTDKDRIICENESFLSFCPFVPHYAFEMWITPKAHSSNFFSLSDHDRYLLARILRENMFRLKTILADPSYNFYLHISPVNYEHEEAFHWHIEIIPQLTREAGFEWGTGFYVVPTSPTVAAEHLRRVDYH